MNTLTHWWMPCPPSCFNSSHHLIQVCPLHWIFQCTWWQRLNYWPQWQLRHYITEVNYVHSLSYLISSPFPSHYPAYGCSPIWFIFAEEAYQTESSWRRPTQFLLCPWPLLSGSVTYRAQHYCGLLWQDLSLVSSWHSFSGETGMDSLLSFYPLPLIRLFTIGYDLASSTGHGWFLQGFPH